MSSQFVLNIDLIRSGEAYGFTFREIAERYGDVAAIPLDPPWRQQIHVYYPALKENKCALASLIAFLKEYDYAGLGDL